MIIKFALIVKSLSSFIIIYVVQGAYSKYTYTAWYVCEAEKEDDHNGDNV